MSENDKTNDKTNHNTNTDSIGIAHLADHVHAVPQLARWAMAAWGHLSDDNSLETRIARFKQRATPGVMPETLVAVDGEQVVGMASLVESDLSIRPDLGPWMAAVYVDAAYRNRGVGSQIVCALMVHAARAGHARLYLITHDRMSFYARMGWLALERVRYRGEDVTVMAIDLI